ncbi:hypothetical protein TWF730_008364 [Orbilia blumenaviensis]|uniref:DUF7908 domain-containing protein n=1 Tax=Orbilia blumenaviensis TaxID=1796055 RepID=A0AAV9V3D0_9PEZI
MAPPSRWLQICFLSILSVPSFALPHADTPYVATGRKDHQAPSHCQKKPLGFVPPYPGSPKSTITITKQGQAVATYIPTATTCIDGSCKQLYSKSTYNWYSTWLPGPDGPQFVTRGDETVTIPPVACATCGPRNRLKSHYCSKNGIHTVNGQVHRVYDAPKYVYYTADIGYSYQITDVNSYFRWLHNTTSGITIDVQNIDCVEGVCTQKVQTWVKDQKVKKEVKKISTEFKGYCNRPGACTLSAQVSDYGKAEIVVWVKSKGAVSRVSTQQITITRTQVVTSTITRTRKSSSSPTAKPRMTSSCTSSKRPARHASSQTQKRIKTRSSSLKSRPSRTTSLSEVQTSSVNQTTPLPTPAIESEFLLALDVIPPVSGRRNRRQTGKLNPDYFVRFDNGNLTFSKNGRDGLKFSLSNGELTANGGYLKAFVNNDTIPLSQSKSVPVRMDVPQPDDILANISSFYNGFQHVLVWNTRKVPFGTALVQFCVRKDTDGDSGQVYVFWDAMAPEGCSLAALFIFDGPIPSSTTSALPTTSSGLSSSETRSTLKTATSPSPAKSSASLSSSTQSTDSPRLSSWSIDKMSIEDLFSDSTITRTSPDNSPMKKSFLDSSKKITTNTLSTSVSTAASSSSTP